MGAVISHLGGGDFVLLERFSLGGIRVPAGFISDLDSVPRIPVFYTVFKGRTTDEAIIHDYLYSIGFDRRSADEIFLQLMERGGVRRRYRLPIYFAVRSFGWVRYKRKSSVILA
jgi:hypothetical protein